MDGLILVGMLLLQEVLQQSHDVDDLRIEAAVVLGSNVSAPGFSEVKIGAYSNSGGTLSLQTVGASPDAQTIVQLTAGRSTEIRLPIGIAEAGPALELAATLNGGPPTVVPVPVVRHARPPALLAGDAAGRLRDRMPEARPISSASLPWYAPAYRQLAALAIDGPALAALDEAQLRALLDFAGNCGRLLLIDASDKVTQVFTSRAACGGRFVVSVAGLDRAEVALASLLAEHAVAPVSSAQLARLTGDDSQAPVDISSIGIFWCGYLVVFGVLAARPQTRLAAAGFSLVGTALVVVIWPQSATRTYVAWAEAAGDDRVARYSALQAHSAPRHGTHRFAGGGFGANVARVFGDGITLQWDAADGRAELVWTAAPFGRMEQWMLGSFAVDANLGAERSADGAVVCNRGGSNSRPAYLQLDGMSYAVPALQPGARWALAGNTPETADRRDRALLRLLAQRSASHALALLHPLPVTDGALPANAWLMRTFDAPQPASACDR